MAKPRPKNNLRFPTNCAGCGKKFTPTSRNARLSGACDVCRKRNSKL